jgi:hypothetical protein
MSIRPYKSRRESWGLSFRLLVSSRHLFRCRWVGGAEPQGRLPSRVATLGAWRAGLTNGSTIARREGQPLHGDDAQPRSVLGLAAHMRCENSTARNFGFRRQHLSDKEDVHGRMDGGKRALGVARVKLGNLAGEGGKHGILG